MPSRNGKDADRKQLRRLEEERNQLQASIKGLEAQIAFWQSQTKAKAKKLNEANSLSAAIFRSTKKAWQEKSILEGQCEKLEQRIAALQSELKNAQETARQDWEVTLSLASMKQEQRSLPLRYAYLVSECGWTPHYRLEARPLQNNVEFSWDAEVWQNTLEEWKNVDLFLANTMAPNLADSEKAPDWKVAARKAGGHSVKGDREKVGITAPERNPVAPFLRHLGKRTVPSGGKLIFPVNHEIWPATFTHVLRPFSSSASQIMAEVSLTDSLQIPENAALIFRQGILQGNRPFSFTGTKKTIFFGSDPDVTGEVKLLSNQEGNPALEGGKQVWDWHWRIVLKNERDHPVKLKVEEPVPQAGSNRIKCSVRGEPAFQQDPSLLGSRELEIPPGDSRSLETFVRIKAPQDMQIDMSWKP